MTDKNTIARQTVDLGERSYDILVGEKLIGTAGQLIRPFLKQNRTFIITDENVARHHLPELEAALAAEAISFKSLILESGEQTKSFVQLERVIDFLLENKVDRKSTLIAFGGGVIGDLAGFAAAVVMRGIDFIQIPTTLLSQVDSSVGGKTGINTARGKNLVGSFHQPRLVIADSGTLQTLPHRELLAGYAEVVKYGLINDPGFFHWLEKNGEKVVAGDIQAQTRAVITSCQAKASIVAMDERESGARGLLNLGHTFGHALEAEAGYNGSLLHGEAISIGMVMAHDLSARLGLCSSEDARTVRSHFNKIGLPVEASYVSSNALKGKPLESSRLLEHMSRDKKASDGHLTFVMTKGIGQAYLDSTVDMIAVARFLEERVTQ
ncbi:3-dehydroquinate synthase [Kiloniella laminariae]|uniref:3-dehydroquinate synthase n=1 Tax=Kiloniella laminariae TaxID=454162 RepID=UPI00036B194D|nr:3-dehydroquinate synthase [Kiloniella laminariae]